MKKFAVFLMFLLLMSPAWAQDANDDTPINLSSPSGNSGGITKASTGDVDQAFHKTYADLDFSGTADGSNTKQLLDATTTQNAESSSWLVITGNTSICRFKVEFSAAAATDATASFRIKLSDNNATAGIDYTEEKTSTNYDIQSDTLESSWYQGSGFTIENLGYKQIKGRLTSDPTGNVSLWCDCI